MNYCILFTLSYPFSIGGEYTFIKNELPYLIEKFDKVIIYPLLNQGEKDVIDERIVVNESLANYFSIKNQKSYSAIIRALFSKIFLKEYLRHPLLILSPKQLFRTLRFISNAFDVMKWYDKCFPEIIKNDSILLYTYWCTSITLGLGLKCKQVGGSNKIISRAHGIDLYEDRGSVFARYETLKVIDKVFLVSEAGMKYLEKKYPDFSQKYSLATLGTLRPSFITKQSEDGIFRIVSCSSVDENKRVQLIAQALNEVMNMGEYFIEWTHFGAGTKLQELEDFAECIKNDKLVIKLKGQVSNNEILRFYKENPIDVFITTSASEGRPFSIIEALACGIPIIGTNVGGIPEIVNKEVGILLSSDPAISQIAEAIIWFITNYDGALKMRTRSIKNWEKNLNAEINFKIFSDNLFEIIKK